MKLKQVEFRKILFEKGLSIRQVAEQAKVQPETLYGNLRNPARNIRWNVVLRLCQALECDPIDIAEMDT